MSITARNLTKQFGSFVALDNVSVEAPTGSLLALLGPSGSGKTTLLRILAGLEVPDSGSVMHQEDDITRRSAKDRNVGFVFQHYALFRHMTVFENVAFGLRVRRWKEEAIQARVRELLALVRLEEKAERFPPELSGGQRQRIALVRALAPQPKVLLLDEPFGALDAKVRTELRQWLRRFHDELDVTSIFVTHDQDEAFEVADRIVIMNKGRVEQDGTPGEVFEHPANAFVMDFLGNVNFLPVDSNSGRTIHGSWSLPTTKVMTNERGEAGAYLRPHELDIERSPAINSIHVDVLHINPAGSVVKVRVWSEDFRLAINVDIPPERHKALGLKSGERVYVVPKASLTAVDYSI
ncbi:MAG: sulfate/molybdate ABC transporter ATP-binding protein [Gemmataceae bacterium]